MAKKKGGVGLLGVAVAVTRKRCGQYPWVLEFDIKGLFDNIDHALLLRAPERHAKGEWARGGISSAG